MRTSRHRVCPSCGSRKLVKQKRGLLVHAYHCRQCGTAFRGLTLYRVRLSWKSNPETLVSPSLSGRTSAAAASVLFWTAIGVVAIIGLVIVWLQQR